MSLPLSRTAAALICAGAALLSLSAKRPATPQPVATAKFYEETPFLSGGPDEGMLRENATVVLPAAGVRAGRVFVLGLTHSQDVGSGGWGPVAKRRNRYALGTEIGAIEFRYVDGTKQRVPLVFGFNVWWYDLFYTQGYQAPFDTPEGEARLAKALWCKPTGLKPPEAFLMPVKVQDKPLQEIALIDSPDRDGFPIISSVTVELADGSNCLAARPDAAPIPMQRADESRTREVKTWLEQKSVRPERVAQDMAASLDSLRAVMYTSAAEMAKLQHVPLEIPADYQGPKVKFEGDLSADLITNMYYANMADLLAKTSDGIYRTSTPGAANWSRYRGIGTWKDGVGWNQASAWSRDMAPTMMELCNWGYADRAAPLAPWAFSWARWYREQHIVFPDGTPVPPHWTRVINRPTELWHNERIDGTRENDGHGLLMLGTYTVWLFSSDKVGWVKAHWADLKDAAEWIFWQFEHPKLSHATNVLGTEGESARKPGKSVYADFMCAEGLRAYAEMADAIGDDATAKRWRERADSLMAELIPTYTKEDAKFGRVFTNAFSWGGHYPILGPLITLPDYRGFDLQGNNPEFAAVNRNTYLWQLHEHTPEPPTWHMQSTGYGQSFMTEAALLLDRMDEVTALIDVMARLSYFPGFKPYVVPEGVDWTDDHQYWYRICDLGNGVQEANFIKTLRLVVGVDGEHHERPRLVPRLPNTWTRMSVEGVPILTAQGAVTVTFDYRRTAPNAYAATLKSDRGIPHLAARLGPFVAKTTPAALAVTVNGAKHAFTVQESGESAWVWVNDLPEGKTLEIVAAVAR